MLYLETTSKNKKKLIASKISVKDNFFSRGTGLMFHKQIKDEAYIFPFKKTKKVAITMIFVFFPIDILFLDKQKKIVEIKENLKPFSDYFPQKESNYVIEVSRGTVKTHKIKVGHKLSF